MRGRRTPLDELQKLASAYRESGWNQMETAKKLGMARTTLQSRLEVAASQGMLLDAPVSMPGYQIKSVASREGNKWIKQVKAPGDEFEAPAGFSPGRITVLTDADGRETVKWQRWTPDERDPLAVAEDLKNAFKDYKPAAKPRREPRLVNEDLLTIVPCNDWHLGMFGWGQEVGTNWDLKIAEDTIGNAVEDAIFRSPASSQGIVLGGGDLLHADNKNNQTANSGNQLDVDGRYAKVLDAASRLMVRTIDAALQRHRTVLVRVLPGNHDEHSAVAVSYFLKAWFRKDPRVTVDTDPSLFWWYRFGECMFGATHGHTVKIANMPGIMAHRRAEDWGATKFRYVHGFHLHHSAKIATEGGGVLCETHQAPIPQDAWHYGAGFLSGRSIQAITYHSKFGEVGRVRVAMLDAA